MSIKKQIILNIILLMAVLYIFETTDIDISVQDYFYFPDTHQWLVDKKDPILKILFYTGPKSVIIIFGSICFLLWVLSYKISWLNNHKTMFMMITLALIIIPSGVSILKNTSNVYTPSQIVRYGGNKPYVKVFGSYPEKFSHKSPGKGWPAGHASGGFALMVLYFCFTKKSLKTAGLLTGLSSGWIMGIYQMLKGAHYLSHTVITMSISWILILVIYEFTHKPSFVKKTDNDRV